MGIESDQVVYEYLSRVGDVAQQRQLSSATRMRLVADLRNEIDRRRAKATVDSPAAVRRILTRLGSPDEVVAAAADGTGSTGSGTGGEPRGAAPASLPVQPDREPEERGERAKGVLRRVVPRPRPARPAEEPRPAASEGAAPPHLAAAHELGDSAVQPDWWRVDSSPFGAADEVPGFVGGVELPDLLKPPPQRKAEKERQTAEEPAPAVEAAEEAAAPGKRRRLPRLPASGWSNPLLLVAAGLLVAGAVLGNWFVLLLGWLIAYASRRLTPAETKWAVVILPSTAVVAGLVWLWGRMNDRWGDPIAEGHMNDAVAETWPWVVRGAAVASALFLVWRSQRSR
ncbi:MULTISPECIES: membrane protein [Streptomyces]|uniref:membrane protein n=1 Tax=Streptomyces TaxID=1883 RepID=UPI0004A10B3E|nr:membrane protein [Streptomyces olindensis]